MKTKNICFSENLQDMQIRVTVIVYINSKSIVKDKTTATIKPLWCQYAILQSQDPSRYLISGTKPITTIKCRYVYN